MYGVPSAIRAMGSYDEGATSILAIYFAVCLWSRIFLLMQGIGNRNAHQTKQFMKCDGSVVVDIVSERLSDPKGRVQRFNICMYAVFYEYCCRAG